MATPKRKAVSYRRFSNPSQLKGDSIKRQLEKSRKYAEAHDLDLDESIKYEDKGISAHHSKHREEGKLGALIAAIKSGSIPQGTIILVESLDRLSRDTVDEAFDQFRMILKLGVDIVTLEDQKHYQAGEYGRNFGDLMISLTIMWRSFEESDMKSQRLKAAWKSKRDRAIRDKKPLTAITPGWIELEGGEYRLIPGRDEIVRRMFQLYIDGHGAETIAKALNREGVEPFNGNSTKGWYGKTVQLTLKSLATIGSYQPHEHVFNEKTRKQIRQPVGEPIKGYFPAVIPLEIFQKAAKIRAARLTPKGHRGLTYANLFTGMAVCSQCGSSLHSLNKGKTKKGANGQYLVCSTARRGHKDVCTDTHHWKYPEVEKAVLDSIDKVTFTRLFPDLHTDQRQIEIDIENRILKLERQLEETTQELENVQALLIKRPDNERMLTVFDQKETEEARLKSELEAATESLHNAKTAQHSFESTMEKTKAATKRLREIMSESGTVEEKYNLRSKLHILLKSQFTKLEFVPSPNNTPVKIWTPDYLPMTDSATGGYVDEDYNPVSEEDVWLTEKECAGVINVTCTLGPEDSMAGSYRVFVLREKPFKYGKSKKAFRTRFEVREQNAKYEGWPRLKSYRAGKALTG